MRERTVQEIAKFYDDRVELKGWIDLNGLDLLILIVCPLAFGLAFLVDGVLRAIITTVALGSFGAKVMMMWRGIVTDIEFRKVAIEINGNRFRYEDVGNFSATRLPDDLNDDFSDQGSADIWLTQKGMERFFVARVSVGHPAEIVSELNQMLEAKRPGAS